MERLTELLKQKKEFNSIKKALDSEAPFTSWDGMAYARTLTQLVLIELELEAIEKDAVGSALR